MQYNPKFIEFEKFWRSKVEKKLFRCSKDLGFYAPLQKVLNPQKSYFGRTSGLYKIWEKHTLSLSGHLKSTLDFNEDLFLFRKYPVITALKDNRHLSQVIIFSLLLRCDIDNYKLRDAFYTMNKELFKGHKISSFVKEKWYYVKIFFS